MTKIEFCDIDCTIQVDGKHAGFYHKDCDYIDFTLTYNDSCFEGQAETFGEIRQMIENHLNN